MTNEIMIKLLRETVGETRLLDYLLDSLDPEILKPLLEEMGKEYGIND